MQTICKCPSFFSAERKIFLFGHENLFKYYRVFQNVEKNYKKEFILKEANNN